MDPTMNPNPMPNPTPNPVPNPNPVPAQPGMPNPATNPVQPANQNPAQPVMPTPEPLATPVNPIVHPTNPGMVALPDDRIAATDPIMKPEPVPEPDPIEEELKAPMKAAEPVPGSIGSAMSGPEGTAVHQTPSVAFNDPAMQPDVGQPMPPVKKKNSRTTLIVLIAIAAVVIVALIVILVLQLTSGNQTTAGTPSTEPTIIVEEEEEEEEPNYLVCTKALSEEELVAYTSATSGAVKVEAEFGDDGLSALKMTQEINYEDGTQESLETSEALIDEEFNAEDGVEYGLGTDKDGELYKTFAEVESNYKDNGFKCERETR